MPTHFYVDILSRRGQARLKLAKVRYGCTYRKLAVTSKTLARKKVREHFPTNKGYCIGRAIAVG